MTQKNKIKKNLGAILIATLLFSQSFPSVALAYEAPNPPPPPENNYTRPSQPTPPPPEGNGSLPPPSPTQPPAPTWEEALNPSPTPTPEPVVESSSDSIGGTQDSNSSGSTESDSNAESSTLPEGGQNQDGQTGGNSIDSGDATTSAVISTDANNNSASLPTQNSAVGNGFTIVDSENGSDSTNTGSVTIEENNNTTQGNSATIVNDLNQSTTTGQNSVSNSTGGDNAITTGDANTSGTAITSVNTNLAGVAVYEFNIADNYNGDYILDFNQANCVSGCLQGSTDLVNSGNGSDSTNTTALNSIVNSNTFQQNDATVENNLVLASDSGNNAASRNTAGDNTIETGDANVAANVLTFANNNLVGGVIYGVVNIYGDLVGDIVLPDGTVVACCLMDTTIVNSENGSGSTNTASVDQTTNNLTNQSNDLEIDNNLILSATTGGNGAKRNTNGDNSVSTGEANIIANVVNFANNNILGGDWWLVIVNEGGKWIGKIIGASENTNIFGSNGFAITTDQNGEVVVTNSHNGSGSTDTGQVSQETNNTIVQTNEAKIVNNLNLSANTGENSASNNTGGNNSIETGDANIIANIVNFVNNNIVGTGRLFVAVVNVFGSWLGDFVGPGFEKEETKTQGLGGVSGNNELGNQASNSQTSVSQNSDSNDSSETTSQTLSSTALEQGDALGLIAHASSQSPSGISDNSSDGEVALVADSQEEKPEKRVVKINLAWLLYLIPLGALYIIFKKKTARGNV